MLVQFVLNVVVLSDICFSVLIQLIESYELLCVCSSDFIVCFFLIVVMMIFQCEHEHSVCSNFESLQPSQVVFLFLICSWQVAD